MALQELKHTHFGEVLELRRTHSEPMSEWDYDPLGVNLRANMFQKSVVWMRSTLKPFHSWAYTIGSCPRQTWIGFLRLLLFRTEP